MSRQVVSTGDWIRIPLGVENWPVMVQIDHAPEIPAFIDRIPEAGGFKTVAAVRCPRLRSGRHTAKARTPDGIYTERFDVR